MSQTGTEFAVINGIRIYYEIAGEGHPFVLVHAGIADSRMWDAQFYAFAEQYKVLRFDMRGYGKSAMVAAPYSHRQDLCDLLKTLGIEKTYLLGSSLGGGQIIDFVLEHAGMVAALILVGSNPNGYEFKPDDRQQWQEAEAAFKAGDFERASKLEVELWVDGPHRIPDQVDSSVRDRVREMNVIALKSEALGLGTYQSLRPRAIGRLDEIRAPTLVIVGDLDDPQLLSAADLMESEIKNAKKVIMTGTAHLPNMERPDEFNRIVLEFLGRLR